MGGVCIASTSEIIVGCPPITHNRSCHICSPNHPISTQHVTAEQAKTIALNEYSAIGLTWYIPKNCRSQFEKSVEHSLIPHLTTLHAAAKIISLLPFHHKPLKGGSENSSAWTDYWVVMLPLHADSDEIWQLIKGFLQGSTDYLVRTEVLRAQPNMSMYYSQNDGVKREPTWHVMEYVVSNPQTRIEYYKDQYNFSAKIIGHFWEKNAVERMIGFETERLLEDKGALPKWDVIHITGFRPFRLGKIAWHLFRSISIFNNLAKKIGYKSAMAVLRSWDVKRIKYLTLAKQDHRYTLQQRDRVNNDRI